MSNVTADNFQKTCNFYGLTPEPVIGSCDTGQWKPCFDSCQLMKISGSRLPHKLEGVRFDTGYHVVWMGGRTVT